MMLIEIGRQLHNLAAISTATCSILFADISNTISSSSTPTALGPGYDISNDGIVRLKACSPTSNCVSSNYLEPPNRYISPLKIVNERDLAFQRAIKDLQQQKTSSSSSNNSEFTISQVISKDYYIHLTTAGTTPGSYDDIELTYPDSGDIVNIRCEARVTLPPPPFCVKKNCINGNMDQRKRLSDLMYLLGLPPADQTQMQEGAKWTPIFFNSDRVPGFYDDYEYEYN